MCGIIGAASSRGVGKILVNGLKKMEYRGYDSAGLALNQDEKVFQLRTLGKVSNLQDLMIQERPRANSGIAHTRWACLLYTSPSPRDRTRSRMPSSA